MQLKSTLLVMIFGGIALGAAIPRGEFHSYDLDLWPGEQFQD